MHFIDGQNVSVIAFNREMADAASHAFAAFGRGSGHPARLNFGDCLAYAVSAVMRAPLLFNGSDFGRSDVMWRIRLDPHMGAAASTAVCRATSEELFGCSRIPTRVTAGAASLRSSSHSLFRLEVLKTGYVPPRPRNAADKAGHHGIGIRLGLFLSVKVTG